MLRSKFGNNRWTLGDHVEGAISSTLRQNEHEAGVSAIITARSAELTRMKGPVLRTRTSRVRFDDDDNDDCLGRPALDWCPPRFRSHGGNRPSLGFKSGHRICTRRTIMGTKAGGRIEECAKGKSSAKGEEQQHSPAVEREMGRKV